MVRKKAKLEYSTFNVHQQYSETVIQRFLFIKKYLYIFFYLLCCLL